MAEGRRQRTKSKLTEVGFDALASHECLEAMLYAFEKRKDTGMLARELLKRFGSLRGVILAKEEELLEVPLMPKSAAYFFGQFQPFYERVLLDEVEDISILTPQKLKEYLSARGIDTNSEFLEVISLNSRHKFIRRKIFNGDIDFTVCEIRKIADEVVSAGASRVILAHNHPSGSTEPSSHDIEATQKIKNVLECLGITLDEHVIVTPSGGWFSFRDNGIL
ncbi:MAG: hypothetical protein FWD49_00825 [Firmicutes bacterium]|nr:hypothetical protein [Bacillota bacterium]